LVVGETRGATPAQGADALKVENLQPPESLSAETAEGRIDLLRSLNERFLGEHASPSAVGHDVAYRRALRLMRSAAAKAFDLDQESAATRDRYGRSRFGQSCLLARRLIERGVPFVEVTLSGVDDQVLGWDTHANNFDAVQKLSDVLDPAWAALLDDLKAGGLLDTTLTAWMGEFGRTPVINANGGRDHFPNAWSTALAGGGIRGGQAIGRTSKDGMTVEDRPVAIAELLATICKSMGIDPATQNISNTGRPIDLVDAKAQPIAEMLR